jgi:predicted DCC family thiol-disulfide oxidoreductase YuxK
MTAGPADRTAPLSAGPVLLFDGDCPLCHASVRFVLRHERRPDLRFAPLGGPAARRLLADRPDLAAVDSLMWVEHIGSGGGKRVLVRSAAALRTARSLGLPWSLLSILWIVPRPLRDAVYDAVARRRRRLVRADRCPPLPPAARERFLAS